jgi:hypothetical protein
LASGIVKILRDYLAGQTQGEPEWYDKAIELHRHHEEFEADRDAQRQAEEEAANAPKNPVDILRAALAGSASTTTALNSAEILRAALGGGSGTINGEVIQGRNG